MDISTNLCLSLYSSLQSGSTVHFVMSILLIYLHLINLMLMMVLTENTWREISYLSVSRVPQSMMERDRRVDSHTCRSRSSPISRLPLITKKKGQLLQAFTISISFKKFEDLGVCSTDWVLLSAHQHSLYPQHKFW